MLPYLVIAVLIMVYVYLVVPETKNKSSSEIQKFFQRRNKSCRRKSFEVVEQPEQEKSDEEQSLSKV